MTKEEFQSWVTRMPEAEQRNATGFFTTIRRNPDRSLKAVPYNENMALSCSALLHCCGRPPTDGQRVTPDIPLKTRRRIPEQ